MKRPKATKAQVVIGPACEAEMASNLRQWLP